METDGEIGFAHLPNIFIDWSYYGIDRVNTYGKRLLDICKINLVMIFNGRLGEDHKNGKTAIVYGTLLIM